MNREESLNLGPAPLRKEKLVFLSVPESLRGPVEHLSLDPAGEAFTIDPAIPLPVELALGAEALNLEDLSWEMILAGMIRVLAEDPQGTHARYYRGFVLAVKPDILTEFTTAAFLKAHNGDYDLALEIIGLLEGIFPGLPALLLNRALILEEQAQARGELTTAEDEAYKAYQAVLDLHPPFPPGIFHAAFFFMKRRNFEAAHRCFQLYLQVGDEPEKQEQAVRMLEAMQSQSLDDALFQEAYTYIREDKPAQGLVQIGKFLEQHPQVWHGWFLLGWALRKLGRWHDGIGAFRKALDLGGDTGDTRNELALCLMESGDWAGARKELEAALWEEPENIKIVSNLGVLALKTGNLQEAEGFFRTVLELDPQDPVAQEYFRAE
ncbi:MAG: tetratricopeptide repeat protein [Treponema sp.]|jgi:tetratricopeptide (TPR) repeat protein|nr:tetratricopeptide repeat protein [Treponema sp.]